jgi:alpha-tubulin suppressor-like RCC1 family protein
MNRKEVEPARRAKKLRILVTAWLALFVSTYSIFVVALPAGGHAGVQKISAGLDFTCALTAEGAVKCWGRNYFGQLGNGSTTDHALPSMVAGIFEPVVSIAVGRYHACALTTSGGVKCWGKNNAGQLGNGTNQSSSLPVDVAGLASGAIAVSAGWNHSCAITLTNVLCWGSNFGGQLGDGTTTSRSIPAPVLYFGTAADIVTGAAHTCAIITSSSGVYCWGSGSRGQLGLDNIVSTTSPIDPAIGLESGVSEISSFAYHSCAVLSATGRMKCWGANEYGQLGDGTTEGRFIPVDVVSMESGVTTIAAGELHTCAAQGDAVKCWGFNNTGRLGNGERPNSTFPVSVIGLANPVFQIAAGYGQTCVWHGSETYSCWGNNMHGAIGNGRIGYAPTPQLVVGFESGVVDAEVGLTHSCAVKAGAVYCWGDNRHGQLGDNTFLVHESPAIVPGLESGMSATSVSGNHSCALSETGLAMCWGENDFGQLGDGTTSERGSPVEVLGLGSGLLQLETAYRHSCALTSTHGVKCWGYNEHGQLGDGTTETRLFPIAVSGLDSGVQRIQLGSSQSCAILDSGSVKCWGALSDEFGNNVPALLPIDMPAFGSGVALLDNSEGLCLVNADGPLECKGYNEYGQLGDGTTQNSFASFVQVIGFDLGATSVVTGGDHACGVMVDGAAYCWGYNYAGVLGNPGLGETGSSIPVGVLGLDAGVTSVSGGWSSTCAISTSGSLKCWGQNLYGQLGTGESGAVLLPVPVLMNEEIFRSGFD